MRNTLLVLILSVALFFIGCASSRATALAHQAERQLAREDFIGAAASYQAASTLRPKHAAYLYNSLWSRYQANEYQEVITLSDQAYQRFSAHPEFLLLKAKALIASGAAEDAFALYEEIFAKEEHPEALKEAVMDQAHALGYDSVATALALELIRSRQYEKQALSLLAEIYPDAWYEQALLYLSHQAEE